GKRRVVYGLDRLLERADERLGAHGGEIAEDLHLHPRGEGSSPSRDDGRAHALIARELLDGCAQLGDELGNYEIERWTVEDDPGAAVPCLDADEGAHAELGRSEGGVAPLPNLPRGFDYAGKARARSGKFERQAVGQGRHPRFL